jgi:polyisoprenoid-binding protein YceI
MQNIGWAQIFTTITGHADFISVAPLETISASSEQLQGILDLNKKTFAFKMYIKSFDGFNSQLQKVHFFENYMEANDFPVATFKGKILEDINSATNQYRAKGMLQIHGVEMDRIIDIEIDLEDKTINFRASFKVPLIEHNIDLPRIVYQKIAEEILVNVNGNMKIKE